jgi:hypothetical protein
VPALERLPPTRRRRRVAIVGRRVGLERLGVVGVGGGSAPGVGGEPRPHRGQQRRGDDAVPREQPPRLTTAQDLPAGRGSRRSPGPPPSVPRIGSDAGVKSEFCSHKSQNSPARQRLGNIANCATRSS